mmetsp:Transcript_3400/g.5736  ORF Transcript_3400/g.5736 Transcript_3400/m.5736 type:complete len:144 (+) Transcript_3400:108-539(+)
MNKSDNIDPAALSAEIGGEEIAQEVKGATAGVAEQALVQLQDTIFVPEEKVYIEQDQDRRIVDEDGDGVEDNVKKSQKELDGFRKKVFGSDIEDMHNTHNGEVPGHVSHGEDSRPAGLAAKEASAKAAKETKVSAKAAPKAEK